MIPNHYTVPKCLETNEGGIDIFDYMFDWLLPLIKEVRGEGYEVSEEGCKIGCRWDLTFFRI